jgi:hypothetical protein
MVWINEGPRSGATSDLEMPKQTHFHPEIAAFLPPGLGSFAKTNPLFAI